MSHDLSRSPPVAACPSSDEVPAQTDRSDTVFLRSQGYCVTCDRPTTFVAANDWLRDSFICSGCGSIPRERALMLAIERFFPQWRGFVIHESSPGDRGASVKLIRGCPRYVGSHFFEYLDPGEIDESGWCNQNLERQTFAPETFDLVVSQDVMEHLLRPDLAFQEIARTLKPGGAHVFTVPLVRKALPTQIRAIRREDGRVEHLLPPEYHGNPIDARGSLVTLDWGYDICDFIQRCCGMYTTVVYIDDLSHGIRAEHIEVLVSRKPRGVAAGWRGDSDSAPFG